MIAYNILEEILDLADEILATEKHSIVLNIKKMDSNHEVSVLLKAVRRNNNIFNVILQYNNLSGGNGGFAIQDMIKKSKSIINLDLSNNRICNSEQRYMVLTAERSNRKINITFNTKIDDNRIYNENRKQYLLYAFNSAPPGATVYFVDESSSSSNSSDTEMEPEKYDVTKWKAIVY